MGTPSSRVRHDDGSVVDGAPATVRQFLRLVPVRIAYYQDLKAAIKGFMDRGSVFDSEGNKKAVPMEIGM
eukprot:8673018-Heterocapsa_arctica.AAC.1